MSILDKILEVKKNEVKKLRNDFSLSRFKDSEFFEKARLSLYESLTFDNDISVIAEVKKASPSKGILRKNFNHRQIAESYIESGANALSILTDKNFFQGDIVYLKDIAMIKTIPILRKDFIIDEYQILEAKSNGADVVLLIAEALSTLQLQELTLAANEYDLETLLEFHSNDQIEKIDFSLNKIIGVNNRDLNTFNVDIQTTLDALDVLPEHNIVVSESGIKTRESIDKLLETRTNAVLVGEHLMKKKNVGDALKELKKWCMRES